MRSPAAPKAQSAGNIHVIGNKRMANQEKFADRSDNSAAPEQVGKESSQVK
jgi:hypothetical protein